MDITLSGNEQRVINRAGNYLYVKSATGGLELYIGSGESMPLESGIGYEFLDIYFDTFTITDLSGSTNTVELEIRDTRSIRLVDNRTNVATLESLLTTISSTLSAIDLNTDGLEGYTDGIEGLLTTIAGYVDQLETYTDGLETSTGNIETLIGSTNTLLTAMNGYVDGIEGYTDGLESLLTTANGLLTAIGGYVDQLEGYTDGLETKLDSLITQTKIPDTGTDGAVALTTAAATEIVAANANNREVTIKAEDGDVSYGYDAAITTGNITLKSGQSKTWNNFAGAIYAIRHGAATVNVTWETSRVS